MNHDVLNTISPVDGRYAGATEPLRNFFSGKALILYRVRVEAAYFAALCRLPLPQLAKVPEDDLAVAERLARDFSDHDALRVKEIEAVTNHDVKAVEYFIREKISGTPLEPFSEFVHFGLTSQDINNTAMPMMVRDATVMVMIPLLETLLAKLENLAGEWSAIPMLAYTHGQPASPTHLGKEIYVFADRLKPMLEEVKGFSHSGKFGGATGNFNAHKAAYPEIDWVRFGNDFLSSALGLERQAVTTQIEHYDGWASLFSLFMRINTVLTDLNRDLWTYISMQVFTQKLKAGEVGSSAMPHKVNPIDFENSEGNLGVANALFAHLASKLPVSRLQRDLTDSTVTRTIGVPFAHTLIAWKSLMRGLDKLVVNEPHMAEVLDHHWEVLAEPIQTILRREGVRNPYEKLKELTRGNRHITREVLHAFIDTLDVPDAVKGELKALTPGNYTGYDHATLKRK
ncbi:MAG TPA: adenylosuccinate lyase [Bacteroidales bacterium]|nr:adenylosuccinate lyase [Bacteroidales bacterium]HRZ49615.1 adenylosuccinate lyase [Bacteroidales bacterium]